LQNPEIAKEEVALSEAFFNTLISILEHREFIGVTSVLQITRLRIVHRLFVSKQTRSGLLPLGEEVCFSL